MAEGLAPGRTGNTFDFWCSWLRRAFRSLTQGGDDRYRRYIRTRHANPSILGQMAAIRADDETLLCESLAKGFGMPAEGVSQPRLVAGKLMAGSSYVIRRFENDDIDLVKEAACVIDEVEAMFGYPLVERS